MKERSGSTKRLTVETNGVRRTFEGVPYGELFRITRIEGDVTDREAIQEALPEIAELTGCLRVELSRKAL